jgi:ABC-type transporter Mla maintaining outer membrane lipid asymmetry ATPase subunit MlaF
VTVAALELAGVSKAYGGLRPLRIHQLRVSPDESVAIVGFDQPAAEVFVNLVTGATLPEAGEVRVFGRPTSAIVDSADWLATVDRFGIVSERAVLLDQLTLLQNMALPFTLDIEPLPDDVRAKAAGIAAEVALRRDGWDRPIAGLDLEARMRLRLGRALALAPSVLLLEHVSAGLTPDAAENFGADTRAIVAQRGIALVAATADVAFARAVADRVLAWDAASGQLADRRARGFLGRWLG